MVLWNANHGAYFANLSSRESVFKIRRRKVSQKKGHLIIRFTNSCSFMIRFSWNMCVGGRVWGFKRRMFFWNFQDTVMKIRNILLEFL